MFSISLVDSTTKTFELKVQNNSSSIVEFPSFAAEPQFWSVLDANANEVPFLGEVEKRLSNSDIKVGMHACLSVLQLALAP